MPPAPPKHRGSRAATATPPPTTRAGKTGPTAAPPAPAAAAAPKPGADAAVVKKLTFDEVHFDFDHGHAAP